jgi:hypothetical protein
MTDDTPDLPPEIQARRFVEDQALDYGGKRIKLAAELAANTNLIRRLLPDAIAAGIPVERYAQMVGVSRQTLYRWRDDMTHHGSA